MPVFCFYGALKAGAAVVSVNPLYKSAVGKVLRREIRDAEATRGDEPSSLADEEA